MVSSWRMRTVCLRCQQSFTAQAREVRFVRNEPGEGHFELHCLHCGVGNVLEDLISKSSIPKEILEAAFRKWEWEHPYLVK